MDSFSTVHDVSLPSLLSAIISLVQKRGTIMSRTHRVHPEWKMFRTPKTFNQIQQNKALISDVRTDEFEYPISKMNRIHRFIPDAWEDIPISSNFEYQ